MFNTQKEKRSLRDLRQELKKRKSMEVDIINLSTGEIFYECPKTRYKFTLSKLGSKESIELDVLTTLANRNRGFFESHLITIVDFEDEDFTAEDIVEYLGLKDIYTGIENTDVDYIGDILNLDNYDFEKFIKTESNRLLTERIAERAIFMYMRGKFDSHTKRRILSKALGQEDIFDVADVELEAREKELDK